MIGTQPEIPAAAATESQPLSKALDGPWEQQGKAPGDHALVSGRPSQGVDIGSLSWIPTTQSPAPAPSKSALPCPRPNQ